MGRMIIQRLASLLVTIWLLSLIVFAITQVLPGNVAVAILGPYATPQSVATLNHQLGLDQPLVVQYLEWLRSFVTLQWGDSLRMGEPIAPILFLRLENSAYLAAFALIGVVVFGIGLGILAGARRNQPADYTISFVALVTMAAPAFVVGSVLILTVGGGWLHLLPATGYVDPSQDIVGWLLHLVLPGITLMLLLLAYVVRMMRSGLIDALQSNYVRTARLKGVPERRVVLHHALRNAMLPTVTVIAMNIGWMLGSVVIVEQVFAYPGIGSLTLFAVNNRDLPLLQACVMVVAIVTGLANLLADVLYSYLDPRVRYG